MFLHYTLKCHETGLSFVQEL